MRMEVQNHILDLLVDMQPRLLFSCGRGCPECRQLRSEVVGAGVGLQPKHRLPANGISSSSSCTSSVIDALQRSKCKLLYKKIYKQYVNAAEALH